MNITNLIVSLQQAASKSSVTALDCMALSKIIEKLKVGDITTVANTAALPSTLTTNGNMFYVTADEDLYYNVGSTWKLLTQVFNYAYGWGNNFSGQLGDGTSVTSTSSPKLAGVGITAWSEIDTYQGHTLGITTNGVAYAWGLNSSGQLGDGTTSSRLSPVTVIGGITNWSQVSAGYVHSLGITSSGIAYGWGSNAYGRIGNGNTTSVSSPVSIIGGITNWSSVSGGRDYSLGLRSSGILYGWGNGGFGVIGDNTTSSRLSPVTVVGGITTWSKMCASMHTNRGHSIGATSGGLAYCWGYNRYGQLGIGTFGGIPGYRQSPMLVTGGVSTWNGVSVGNYFSLGSTSTGLAYGWGNNVSGKLGDGTTSSRASPVTVVGGITNWSQIRAGQTHSIGLTSTGVLYGWGNNGNGQIGDGTTTQKSSPVTIVGSVSGWSRIDAGTNHTVAIAVVSV